MKFEDPLTVINRRGVTVNEEGKFRESIVTEKSLGRAAEAFFHIAFICFMSGSYP